MRRLAHEECDEANDILSGTKNVLCPLVFLRLTTATKNNNMFWHPTSMIMANPIPLGTFFRHCMEISRLLVDFSNPQTWLAIGLQWGKKGSWYTPSSFVCQWALYQQFCFNCWNLPSDLLFWIYLPARCIHHEQKESRGGICAGWSICLWSNHIDQSCGCGQNTFATARWIADGSYDHRYVHRQRFTKRCRAFLQFGVVGGMVKINWRAYLMAVLKFASFLSLKILRAVLFGGTGAMWAYEDVPELDAISFGVGMLQWLWW